MIMKDLRLLSEQFRRAIDAAYADNQFDWEYEPYHKDRMMRFPDGCCDDTCDLFWHYLLIEHNIVLQQISCYYIKGNTRHNWLETQDGLIVDLTGDQFKGRPAVYVDFDDGFYGQMNDRKGVTPYCILNDKRLKRDYDVIMKYMKQELEKL